MKEQKSFVLYSDYGDALSLLSDEEAGGLVKAIFALVREEELPELSKGAQVLFCMVRNTLERDLEKYRAVCERNRENGRRGGRPRGARPTQFGSELPNCKETSRPGNSRPKQFEDETPSNCKDGEKLREAGPTERELCEEVSHEAGSVQLEGKALPGSGLRPCQEETRELKTQKNPEKPKKAYNDSDNELENENDSESEYDLDLDLENDSESKNVLDLESEARVWRAGELPRSAAAPFPPPAPQGEGFSLFWEKYPRKAAKARARREWERLAPSPELTEAILQAVEASKGWESWAREGGRYIPNPATWLREERWEDRPPQDRASAYSSLGQWKGWDPLFDLPEEL